MWLGLSILNLSRRGALHFCSSCRLPRLAADAAPPPPPPPQGQRASISLKALAEAFPSRPPAMIRGYLKDACDLAVRVSRLCAPHVPFQG